MIRLAERAHAEALAPGERRSSAAHVWVVADGTLAITARDPAAAAGALRAGPGRVLGVVRLIAPATAVVEAEAVTPAALIGLGLDDLRDVLDEDPAALGAVTAALARELLAEDDARARATAP